MARGKSLGKYTPSISGKSLSNYKASKNIKKYDSDSDSPLSSLDDSDEDDIEPNGLGDSDVTVDSAPELIVDNLLDLSSDEEDEDEEDDDDDNDSASDSDSDLIPSKFLTPKAKKKLPGTVDRKSRETTPLPIPKRLDLSELRAKQKSLKTPVIDETSDNISNTNSESDEQSETESIESESPSKRKRRESIVHPAYDEISSFPRSDSIPLPPLTEIEDAIINSDNSSDSDVSDNSSNLDISLNQADDSSGDEFDQDSLLAYLEQEESSPEVVDEYEEDDDGHIEKQEEKIIMNDIKNGDDLFSNPSSPYATTPILESEPIKLEEQEEEEEEEEEDDDDEISFDDDFFEPRTNPSNILVSSTSNRNTSPSSDDDSYLWSYFFTDEESEAENNNINTSNSSSTTTNNNTNKFIDDYYSGDETDEDLTIPPPSLRKPGPRATEILSSSAVASRPPVLGSWDLSNERPFGIIDGLTTRTLSPPQSPYFYKNEQPLTSEEIDNILNNPNGINLDDIFNDINMASTTRSSSRKRGRSQSGFQSDSELSELPLDEFIYTDGLDEDPVDTTTWPTRFNDVPMSAFRNRGLQPMYTQPTTRRLSMTTRTKDGRRFSPKEVVMTPVKPVKKRMKKKLRRRKSIQEDNQDMNSIGNTTDLIDELVESGALSPLFSGI